MSKYSGAYDLYDSIFSTSEDLTNEELFKRFKQSGKKFIIILMIKEQKKN